MLAHLASRLLSARSALLRVFRVSDWQITLLWAVVAGLAGAAATGSVMPRSPSRFSIVSLILFPYCLMVTDGLGRKCYFCLASAMTF